MTMYERKNGTKRLLRALEDTENLERLAEVLRYVPEQLEQDIRAFSDYVRDVEETEKEAEEDFERQSKPYGVYEVYTWDDVSYKLLERYETKQEAEARAEDLNKKNREEFVPTENMSVSPICYRALSNGEYYCRTHDLG